MPTNAITAPKPSSVDDPTLEINKASRKILQDRIARGEEARARFVNFRKNGERFENLLTIVPIVWEEGERWKRYIVGFQADTKGFCF